MATYSGGDSKLLLFDTSFELRRLRRVGKRRLNVRQAWIRLLIHFSLPFLGPSNTMQIRNATRCPTALSWRERKDQGCFITHTGESAWERARDLIAEPLTELVKAEKSVICIQAEAVKNRCFVRIASRSCIKASLKSSLLPPLFICIHPTSKYLLFSPSTPSL